MTDRISELMNLRDGGDEDVALLVESEFALMPETREQRMAEAERIASEVADTFATTPVKVDADLVDELAEDAGF